MTVAQLDSLVTLLRSRPTLETLDVAESRARYEKMGAFLGGAPDAKCEKVDAGGVPAEWVAAPGIDGTRAILYLHGGGYVIGSINTHRRLAYDLSAASGARVLVIDYRLAPEHPFPAAVDDAAAAWRWLLQQGFAAGKLTIAGAVDRPVTLRVPIGVTLAQCVAAAGGATVRDPCYLVGGVMMGRLEDNHAGLVDKTTGGVVVLPEDHVVVRRRRQDWHQIARIGRSACDQCSFCTELCPRWLLATRSSRTRRCAPSAGSRAGC